MSVNERVFSTGMVFIGFLILVVTLPSFGWIPFGIGVGYPFGNALGEWWWPKETV